MGQTTAAAAGGAPPRMYMLRGVRLFASGTYRGQPWPAAVVDEMAGNARTLGPSGKRYLTPPAAPGHEDDDGWQKFVGTDEPAAGWVDPDSVRAVPDPDPDFKGEKILVGDVVNVPEEMARKILSGEYKFGSAEIYDDFKDDRGRSFGKALRKFSYLGGEVPQVKRLGPLPRPVPMDAPRAFAERAPGLLIRERRRWFGGVSHTYAEVTQMDRNQMIAAVKAAMPGISQATMDALSDEQLADLAKNLPTPPPPPDQPAAAMGGMGGGMPPPMPGGMFAEDPPREEMLQALADAGEDPAELEGMDDDELGALYDELLSEAEAEAGTDADPEAEPEPEEPTDTEDPDPDEEVETMGDQMADPAAMSREEIIAELTAQGQDPAALEGMSDEDLQALAMQLMGGGAAAAPAPDMGGGQMPPAQMSDRRSRLLHFARMSEQTRAVRVARQVIPAMEAEYRRLQVSQHQRKQQDAVAFCDRLVGEGQLTPALVKASVLSDLLSKDDTRPVHKFTEAGVTRHLTAYELKKRELLKLPKMVHFGERLGGAPQTTDEAEVSKVARFAETQPDRVFQAGGFKGRQGYVERFKKLREKDPTLTAAQYTGQ